LLLSVAIALITVWAAIAISYETNWPIGFFVGSIAALSYAVGRTWAAWQRTRTVRVGRVAGAPAGARP
jgi:zinc/manganese transport system permease protein